MRSADRSVISDSHQARGMEVAASRLSLFLPACCKICASGQLPFFVMMLGGRGSYKHRAVPVLFFVDPAQSH